jgi:hypothetical protein
MLHACTYTALQMEAAARAQRLESAVESAAAAAAEAKQRDIDKYAARRRAER